VGEWVLGELERKLQGDAVGGNASLQRLELGRSEGAVDSGGESAGHDAISGASRYGAARGLDQEGAGSSPELHGAVAGVRDVLLGDADADIGASGGRCDRAVRLDGDGFVSGDCAACDEAAKANLVLGCHSGSGG